MNGIFNSIRKTNMGAIVMMVFLLASFAVKAIIPAGFMPSYNAGSYELVICSGMTQKTITVDGDGNPAAPHNQGQERCTFDLLTAQKIFEPSFVFVSAPVNAFVSTKTKRIYTIEISSAVITAQARAPPLMLI